MEKYLLPAIHYLQRHQAALLASTIMILFGLFMHFQYESYSKRYQSDLSDRYFQIVASTEYPENHQEIDRFVEQNPTSIYSDLIRLQQAKRYFDLKEVNKSILLLEKTLQYSSSKSIRSLAAYRLGLIIKDQDPKRALTITDMIQLKSLSLLKSLLKAEIFEQLGEKAKALLELNSIGTSAIDQTSESLDDTLLIELASRHKRQLLNQDV